MKQKWRCEKGETLVEVLASILVGTLSVALLFGAVMASTKMDLDAKAADEAFGIALNAAEEQITEADESVVPSGSKIKVENRDPGIPQKVELPVTFYGGEGAISYKLP